jgi:hypothetical protein
MIISVSRRTDIPAFYSQWFINRIREGYCKVPNPFNTNQVSTISLKLENVDVIVFWTRNPQPLIPYLQELDQRGYHYYFQFTVLNNPCFLDINNPPIDSSIQVFKKLSGLIGSQKIIWRYDPIVLSEVTDINFHIKNYERIANLLSGYTQKSVISIMDGYVKNNKRLRELEAQQGIKIKTIAEYPHLFNDLLPTLAEIADKNGMEIFSCAEEKDFQSYGIKPGKCIDDEYIQKVFNLPKISHKKDPVQRETCGCVVSKDVGMYDSCVFGCQYCYATTNFEKAKENKKRHHFDSPFLIGTEVEYKKNYLDLPSNSKENQNQNLQPQQLNLFP